MTDRIVSTTTDAGLRVVIEPIAGVASAAINWYLPAGAATDQPHTDGDAALLSELIFRGAGDLDSRAHSDAFDRAGAQRSSHVYGHHLALSSTFVGDRLDDVLPLLTSMVTSATLPENELDAVRSLSLQSLEALEDDPQHHVSLQLREHHLPPPFNRHGYGTAEGLASATIDRLRTQWTTRAVPDGSIMGLAGAVDPDHVRSRLDELLAGWTGSAEEPAETGPAAGGSAHVEQDSSQVHISFACAAPVESDEHSILERLAIGVLGGGSSARLFQEVRVKRSLCYAVDAGYAAGRDRGRVSLYVGTTPERAQETLDLCVSEVHRLSKGVTEDELERARIGLKSRLVMQGESTSARAGAIAVDVFRIGRPRTLDEVAAAVDAITLDQLNAYLAQRTFGPFTLACIGPTALHLDATPVA